MARIASFTSAGVPTGPQMTLDALMLRQKQIADAAGRISANRPMTSPWQGAAYVGEVLANKINQGRADRALAEGRQGLAQAMSGLSMDEGPSPEQIAQVSQYDPDMGMQMWQMAARLMQDRRQRQQELADRDAGWARDDRVRSDERAQQLGDRDLGWAREERIRKEDRAAELADAATKTAADAAKPLSTEGQIMRDFNKGIYGDPMTPEAQATRDKALSTARGGSRGTATDRKALWDTQDAYINSTSAINQLKRASELLDQGINWGYTAGAQNMYEQTAPEWAGGDADTANRTKLYNSIMNQEAIAAMSQALKGATTDTEMAEFIKNMNDPTLDPQIKAEQINTMIAKAQAFNELQGARIGELGGEPPTVGVGAPAPTGGGGAAPAAAAGEEQMLQEARDAIAAGAPADMVRKRLVDKGIDPGKL